MNFKTNLIFFLIGLALMAMILLLVSCCNFKPVVVEGQPDECNDFYTVLRYYAKEGRDSAFVGVVYNECRTARGEARRVIKENHCKDLIFGKDPLDKSDYKRYTQFLECSK